MSLRVLNVGTPGGGYPVILGAGARKKLPDLLRGGDAPSRAHIVTDTKVARLHLADLRALLDRQAFPVSVTIVPAGEESKSVRELTRVWRDCIRDGCDRRACLLALGGGVVGDLAGFASASLLRGVRFIQLPTTLLAMVDASVGGKTGINLPEGKNLVGAFYQPRAVVMDLDFLRTLPGREARAGWAEVIKTAAIRDSRLLRSLEGERTRLLGGEPAALLRAIERCVRIKARVVEADERESGLRMILNFGHTLAHAIEAAKRYRGMLHGEAVAVGMVFAGILGESLGHTEPGTAARLEALIKAYGLPSTLKAFSPARLLEAMGRDKKRGPKGLRWVFLSRIGETKVVENVRPRLVKALLRSFLKRGGLS